MQISYKRDLNYNHLVLEDADRIDMESYDVRLLMGNHVLGLLQCIAQTIDGKEFLHYEITGKQSLASVYEHQKMKREDLQLLFDSLVKIIEEMQDFLLDASGLLLEPEYIYLDEECQDMFFCYFPVKQKEITTSLRELAEYLLPKIDHTDQSAVILGYNIYRLIMEEGMCLEQIKKELHCESNAPVKKENMNLWEEKQETIAEPIDEALQTFIEEKDERVPPAVSTIIVAITGIILFIYFYFVNNTEFSWHIYVSAAVALLIIAGVSSGFYLFSMRAKEDKKEDGKSEKIKIEKVKTKAAQIKNSKNNYDDIERQFEREFSNIVQREG